MSADDRPAPGPLASSLLATAEAATDAHKALRDAVKAAAAAEAAAWAAYAQHVGD